MQFGYCINASNHVAVLRSLSEKVLRGSQCKLRAFVVNVFPGNFTTETQSVTEFAQRNSFFRQTPKRAAEHRLCRLVPGLIFRPRCQRAGCLTIHEITRSNAKGFGYWRRLSG